LAASAKDNGKWWPRCVSVSQLCDRLLRRHLGRRALDLRRDSTRKYCVASTNREIELNAVRDTVHPEVLSDPSITSSQAALARTASSQGFAFSRFPYSNGVMSCNSTSEVSGASARLCSRTCRPDWPFELEAGKDSDGRWRLGVPLLW
jgi:hypothetical protein